MVIADKKYKVVFVRSLMMFFSLTPKPLSKGKGQEIIRVIMAFLVNNNSAS
jgi:hypothetical protein